MTIDSFDWVHRTAPTRRTSRYRATCARAHRPGRILYEGVFAHEYQHLLESYEDSDEFNWINEGLSDWAQTLVGYVNPSVPITEQGLRLAHPVLPRLVERRDAREPQPRRPEGRRTR